MLQSLLADRFKLKVHFETREMPVYELVVAKGGPKLVTLAKMDSSSRQSHGPGAGTSNDHVRRGQGPNRAEARNDVSPWPIDPIAAAMQPEVGNRKVVDQTGLKGHYDLSLDWTREGPATADAAPPFFTALQEQLGLRLVSTKGPVEVIVIDSIELPSAN